LAGRLCFSMENDGGHIDLLTLLRHVKATLERTCGGSTWVKAEISSLKATPYGHCYLELSESDSGKVVAKARATIWSSRYSSISQYFRSVTGTSLAVGQEILALCQVNYSEVYGFSLNVLEINPEFTLGAGEALRRKTIERLRKEGLMDVQKQLLPAALPYRLAVISAEGAAGYGDFCKHLTENVYGFVYETVLFPAAMQGKGAPPSIVAAIASILASARPFDAILILRGGGSELDLACFDDYDLAAAIAGCPIPVYTAIGHERDNHVADMVAHVSVKTPTALADLFVDATAREDECIYSLENRLRVAFSSRMEMCEAAVSALAQRVSACLNTKLLTMNYKVSNFETTIRSRVSSRFVVSGSEFEKLWQRVRHGALTWLSAGESRLEVLETKVSMSDPRKLLEKGYSMVLDADGVRMETIGDSKPGDKVSVVMPDGRLRCEVHEVARNDNEHNTI